MSEQKENLTPEQREIQNLSSQLDAIGLLSNSFPFGKDAEGDSWITPQIRHWTENDEDWIGGWGLEVSDLRLGEGKTDLVIIHDFPDKADLNIPKSKYSLSLTNIDTLPSEEESAPITIDGSYHFIEDGRLIKTRSMADKERIDDLLPGHFEALGLSLIKVTEALQQAKR